MFKILPLIITITLFSSACSLLEPKLSPELEPTTESLATIGDATTPDYDPLCFILADELHDYTPSGPDSLWEKIRSGYQLQDNYNPRMDTYTAYFGRHQRYINLVSRRGDRYLHYIVSELEKRNMPMELALLPIIESAFDPFAYSHGRASGIWQFIPSTGKAYGLNQDWWYDGRRDIVASTNAALDYLQRLAKRFDDDYLLALAAYNAGGGNVNKAIRRNRKAGKPTDFWSLKLPRETRTYVPKLLALSRIIANPEQHRLTLLDIPDAPYFEKIDILSQIDLAQAANLARIGMDELQLLNPAFNRWATAPNGPHYLLIPTDNVEIFKRNLAELPPGNRISWDRYTIRSGDSLLKIAAKYNTSVALLKDVNKLDSSRIRQGKTLLIPVATEPEHYYALSAEQRLKGKQTDHQKKSGNTKIQYRVQSGDSFWKISRQFGVSVRNLAKWNGMAPKDPLKSGQTLVVWSQKPVTGRDSSAAIIRKVHYSVRNGDSLAKIAGKFNLSANDIQLWNPSSQSSKYIQPGQSLKLFVDVTNVN